MGRHASPAPEQGPRPGRELLAWGLFSVPVTVVLLGVIGSTWRPALLVGALELVVFGVAWLAVAAARPSRSAGGSRPGAGDEPSPVRRPPGEGTRPGHTP